MPRIPRFAWLFGFGLFAALILITMSLTDVSAQDEPETDWKTLNAILSQFDPLEQLPPGWKSRKTGKGTWEVAVPVERFYQVFVTSQIVTAAPSKVVKKQHALANSRFQECEGCNIPVYIDDDAIPPQFAEAQLFYGYKTQQYRDRQRSDIPPEEFFRTRGAVMQVYQDTKNKVDPFEKDLEVRALRSLVPLDANSLLTGVTPPVPWDKFHAYSDGDWNRLFLNQVWLDFSHVFAEDRGAIVRIRTIAPSQPVASGESNMELSSDGLAVIQKIPKRDGYYNAPYEVNRESAESDIRILADLVEAGFRRMASSANKRILSRIFGEVEEESDDFVKNALIAGGWAGLGGLLGLGGLWLTGGLSKPSGPTARPAASPTTPDQRPAVPFARPAILDELNKLDARVTEREGSLDKSQRDRDIQFLIHNIEQQLEEAKQRRDAVCIEERKRVEEDYRDAMANIGALSRTRENDYYESMGEADDFIAPFLKGYDWMCLRRGDFAASHLPNLEKYEYWMGTIQGQITERTESIQKLALSMNEQSDPDTISKIHAQIQDIKKQQEKLKQQIEALKEQKDQYRSLANNANAALDRWKTASGRDEPVRKKRDADLANVDSRCLLLQDAVRSIESKLSEAQSRRAPAGKDLAWHDDVWNQYREEKSNLEEYLRTHDPSEPNYGKDVQNLAGEVKKALNRVIQSQDYIAASSGKPIPEIGEPTPKSSPRPPADATNTEPYDGYQDDVDFLGFSRDSYHRKINDLESFSRNHDSSEPGYQETVARMKADIELANKDVKLAEKYIVNQGGRVPPDPGPGRYGDPYAGSGQLRQLEQELQEGQKDWDTLGDIRRIAGKYDFQDILGQAERDVFKPDGSLDVDYLQKLKEALKQRMAGEQQYIQKKAATDTFWVDQVENLGNLSDHWLIQNPLTRIGLGVMTSGSSEIYYQSHAALKAALEAGDKMGNNFGVTDSLVAAFKELGKQNLPVNTIMALRDKNAGLGSIGLGLAMDAFVTKEGVDTVLNVKGSLKGLWKWGGDVRANWGKSGADIVDDFLKTPGWRPSGTANEFMDALTHREPNWLSLFDNPCERIPSTDSLARNINDLPSGAGSSHESFGITDVNGRAIQLKADQYGVDIAARQGNKDCVQRLIDGHPPKPSEIHTKTINNLDTYIGANKQDLGLVGWFQPKTPVRTPDMSDDVWASIQKRFNQRLDEYHDQGKHMWELMQKGDVQVRDGVIYNTGLNKEIGMDMAFTGDHDILTIQDAYGNPVPDAIKNKIIQDLKQFGGGGHGAQADWFPDNQVDVNIHNTIAKGTGANGEAQALYRPGGSGPTVTHMRLPERKIRMFR
jgi:hypothetical protein